MKKRVFNDNEIKQVIDLYKKGESMEVISRELKTSRPVIKKILKDNNIPLNKRGGQVKHEIKELDYSKYDGKMLKCKKTGKTINDVLNRSGSVTNHLKKEFNLKLPTLFKRNMITKTTGKLWYEEYFDLIEKVVEPTWVCPICGWETKDINNHGGSITKHINEHGYTSLRTFFDKYPSSRINLKEEKIDLTDNISNFTSKAQNEIFEYIKSLGFNPLNNHKKILNGIEIDIFIPELNIGFEYNGLFWHSEKMGKDKNYHLSKQNLAKTKGVNLYHIFSDEWIKNKDIVKSKIKHILNKSDKPIYARNCEIREISSEEKQEFLKNNHIQGGDKSKYKIGAFHKNELVAVMTFSNLRSVLGSSNKVDTYELVRFASKNVVGIGSRLLKFFIRKNNPKQIISYADKRWTLSEDNIYTKMGFSLVSETKPNYWYCIGDNKRYHRYNFRKDILVNKGYDPKKTEKQIMSDLGYLRVWDCGNYKYELTINQ